MLTTKLHNPDSNRDTKGKKNLHIKKPRKISRHKYVKAPLPPEGVGGGTISAYSLPQY